LGADLFELYAAHPGVRALTRLGGDRSYLASCHVGPLLLAEAC